ncbi:MAG: ABC transporter permease [Chloroflexi bacterium]|nr:ABC transporter permease [Chloroflexota bacterium]MDA1219606.1 ABC transporter permease [Chloroflexota bacterium]
MQRYLLKRLGLALIAVIGSSMLIFFIMRVIPGDPVSALLAQAELGLTLEEREAMREQFGLHLPIYQQYLKWVWDVVNLDPGISLVRQTSVAADFGRAFPVTAELTLISLIFVIVFSLALGTITAVRQDTWLDYVVRVTAIGGLAIPVFWIGIMVILALLFWFNYTNPIVYVPFTRDPLTNLQQFLLPAFIGSIRSIAVCARMVRSSMLDILDEDYIRTAYAKGLRESVVIMRHALKNAFMPVATIYGVTLIGLFNGVVVVEVVFNLPGLGRLLVGSVAARDYPTVQFLILVSVIFASMINLLVDLTYVMLDPRVRVTG